MTPNDRSASGLRWAAVILLLSPALGAQPAGDPAAARVLFAEGRQLASQHKYEQACPKFEESLRLDFGVGTLFNLADCWEHIGRTASAWARFLDAAAGAKAAGNAERERIAKDRATALESRLSRLTIEVKSSDAGLEVKRDSQQVMRAAWGTAVPVDPGAHVVEAIAPGKKIWTTRVTVLVGQPRVSVTVPSLEDVASAASPSPANARSPAAIHGALAAGTSGGEAGSTRLTEDADRETSNGSGSAQKTVGLVVAVSGVAGVAVGTAFALAYKSKNDAASAVCADRPAQCSPAEIDEHAALVEKAQSNRTIAYAGWGIGGAALALGTVLFFTAPSRASQTGVSAGPLLGGGAFGASLQGKW